jgi:metal-responsive CopG/Arc/MetJ family transcriptional regulator
MTARKIKVSVSLDADLLQVVDKAAAREGTTRSELLERWLRDGQRRANVMRLQEETATYYDSLTLPETRDDSRWAEAAAKSARRLQIDDDAAPSESRRTKRAGRKRKA